MLTRVYDVKKSVHIVYVAVESPCRAFVSTIINTFDPSFSLLMGVVLNKLSVHQTPMCSDYAMDCWLDKFANHPKVK